MKNIIGYQIESADGQHNTPNEFWSFEIFKTKENAEKWLKESRLDDKFPGEWHIIPIYEGDIEEHSFID